MNLHVRTTSFSIALVATACSAGGDDTTAASTGPAPGTTGAPVTTGGPTTGEPTTTAPDPTTGSDTSTGGTDTGTDTGTSTGEPGEVVVVGGFETPESVYWSAGAQAWFVSNIAGMPDQKDGNGYISRLHPDGSVDALKWVENGMHAPKGLRERAGVLYVTDIDRVFGYELATAAEALAVDVPGAVFLNDLTVGPDDRLYVSDTITQTIHRLQPGDPPEVLLQDDALLAPNGLAFAGDALLVTDFYGQLYRFPLDGAPATLVRDFALVDGFMSTADLGFDPATRVAGVPDLAGNAVGFFTVP
jgi:hypothetical protein